VLTVGVIWPPGRLALTQTAAKPELIAEAESRGFDVVIVDDPRTMVEAGQALCGTDGSVIWSYKAGNDANRLDGMVRRHFNAGWYMVTGDRSVQRANGSRSARNLVRVIASLFAFYGVVFGAGSVARDRDEGTLDAELATAVPMWVHPAARWLAGSAVLSTFFLFAVLLFDGLIGTEGASALALHGVASCMASVALGLIVVGRASIETGFIGPLSIGLVVIVSLMSYGLAVSGPEQMIPVASIYSLGASGVGSVIVATLFGAAATAIFTWRATVE
jgi:hypothetical protein